MFFIISLFQIDNWYRNFLQDYALSVKINSTVSMKDFDLLLKLRSAIAEQNKLNSVDGEALVKFIGCTKTTTPSASLLQDSLSSCVPGSTPAAQIPLSRADLGSFFFRPEPNTLWNLQPSLYSLFITIFMVLLLGSLVYCLCLTFLRWNFLNSKLMFSLYTKFPVQVTALFYGVLLFLCSLFLVYYQFSDIFLHSFTIQSVIGTLFQKNWNSSLTEPKYLQITEWDSFLMSYYILLGHWTAIFGYDEILLNSFFSSVVPLLFTIPKDFPAFLNLDTVQMKIVNLDLTSLVPCYLHLGNPKFFTWNVDFVAPFFRESFSFAFSFDGLSVTFIALTTFIISLCICVSWFSYKREFSYTLIILLFITQFLIIIVFSTVDLILFYIAFESVLIPLFFLVGIFGSRERRIKAAYYLMFYTLFGSIPFLLGLLYIWYKTGQTNILLLEPLLYGVFSSEELAFLWFLFLPGFAFKVPLYPFHLWLPEAHVEAPTVGSVILAGLVLKLGGYGFIRFSVGLLYWGGIAYLNIVYWFCLFSMLCAILCAACQIDLKRIIAYGSISHMGLVTLCIFLGSQAGLEAAMVMMLGHGFVSSALFILVGGLYERYHSRNVRYYGGLYKTLPRFGTLMFCFILFDIGVPGSPSFVAEWLAFISVVQESVALAVIMSIPVIIGAGVSLLVCSRVLFGLNERRYYTSFQTMLMNFAYWVSLQSANTTNGSNFMPSFVHMQNTHEHLIAEKHDFLPNEVFVLISLFVSALVLGIFPNFYLQYFVQDLEQILQLAAWLH